CLFLFFFFQAEDGIRDFHVTGVQTCALPILSLPISTVPPCGARTCAAELASRNAKSTVIGTVPTRPRMPSVPKYRLLMDSSLGSRLERPRSYRAAPRPLRDESLVAGSLLAPRSEIRNDAMSSGTT